MTHTKEQLEAALALFMERTGQMDVWSSCLADVASQAPGNAISVIFPYRHQGMWVFDDESVGLDKEPFVAGADTLIDLALEQKGVEDPESGFRLIFSGGEFPEADFKLVWLREEGGGNVYFSSDLDDEGWLCPALLKYFDEPPQQIYIRLEERTD